MSMRSLLAIQNGGLEGLGAYRPLPIEMDEAGNYVVYDYTEYDKAVGEEAKAAAAEKIRRQQEADAARAATPEAQLELARRFQFLASRPGFDYGARSNERNAFFKADSGLGQDIFGTILESVKKSAPGAFKPVKGTDVFGNIKLPQVAAGIKLPSWVPKINVPKPIQSALSQVTQKAIDDLKKKKAESAAGVAAQAADYSGSSSSPTSIMNPWIVGGAAVLIIGGIVAMGRK